MKLKPYPEYKDSGVEWVGEIPKEWNCSKIKHITNVKISNVDKKSKPSEPDVLLCNYTDVYNNEFIIDNSDFMKATASIEQIKKLSLKKGDVIITKDSEAAADIAVPALVKENLDNVVCGYHLALIRPNVDIQGDYLFRLLESKQINNQFVIAANGVTRFGISTYPIKNSYLMVPSIEEQEKISSFLDKKTLEIDLTIKKDTHLIELLKEKRTALINHVVTKGLDPTVKMKDSGVEWIGEIPEDWELKKIKHLVHQIIDTEHKTAPFYLDGKYLVVRTPNIRDGGLILKDAKYTDYDGFKMWTRRGLPESGDILFTREAPAGEACLVPADVNLCIGQRIVLFKINKNKLNSQFGVYSLYSGIADQFIRSLSQGSTVTHFNIADIGNIPLFVPSIKEQEKIVDYLEKETSKINQIINKAENNINLLEEYKKSLIHHVVTGKVDVREVAV